MKLDILSDPICPWCYIGKTHLDRALAERDGNPFDIEWHPFQLNYDMPREGIDRQQYLEAKFGGRDGVVKAYTPVFEAAEAAGLEIAWDKITRTPNTLDAHRMIHWAGLEGVQDAAVVAMFDAYFHRGEDIGRADVLAEVANRAGMDQEVVARLLAGDQDLELITERDAHARQRGVTGVPTFIVGNHHAVVGAQPVELWRRVLDDLEAQAREG
ncbi:DsbA family oxidoreductase [Palleronia caenipelagi]|uniref:DsbA family oxidoreductase n=1 Tax=Palleronia caenipelagi TaxID=2489174 RepID=A0A547Q5Z8_9RHOB|nr:DsbA family oxidoreductase [Palleronia caenipelagi]TRD21791.1 DsbA family oxidoreductase [Palleronia caenipelagi]